MPEEWKESSFVPVYKKGDKTDCSNYGGISVLSTTYKILSNILRSRLTPYAEENTGGHQRGFRRNRSTADRIFCIHQVLEKKMGLHWSSPSAVNRLQLEGRSRIIFSLNFVSPCNW